MSEHYHSELFESDEEANYANFLSINSQIQPTTSTQLPTYKKQFSYNCYKENQPPVALEATTAYNNTQIEQQPNQASIITSSPPTLADIMRVQNEQGNIMRVLLREVKLLRRELKERDSQKSVTTSQISLRLPVSSPEQFINLEAEIKIDKEKEITLVRNHSQIKSY